jgi:hypothetical protein
LFPFHEKLFPRFENISWGHISSRRRDDREVKPLKLAVEKGADLRQERLQIAERAKLPLKSLPVRRVNLVETVDRPDRAD